MLRSSGYIGCVYKMMRMIREGSLSRLISSGRQGYKSVWGESTSRVRLGVLYMDPDMCSFLTEYYPFVVLAPHANRCSTSWVVPGAHRVVGLGTHLSSGPRDVHTTSPRVLCSRARCLRVVLTALASSPWASPSFTSWKSSRVLESSRGWKVL
jgi:hypothetical protein